MKGYVQVYTGDGKGKTTAALGLSIRAAGSGLRVYIAQFIKMGEYSEIKALAKFSDLITVEQFGLGRFIKGKPSEEDIEAARNGISKVKSLMGLAKYDIIVLEEANVAAACGVISVEDILELISLKPDNIELVITGRGADPKVIEKADLVTEMKEIKHYYQKGVQARVGIEK
ncbi:MAG: cob(I)yrinic acid a,c-diamide adenosyltransferase [Desulfobacterium sp.]|nr:cob(I)yrinic acid a,c-diamide adenosyltransferase [Desulfobacterium sp.]MBU3949372.1 cob(I)yrinic acid a,c-diamide adenosyltransferase [Pseudomonadota bacterium]MBU4010341.1 cob(I)yrinic acid a,c-diamide adenosyltransferase [Pseudomonadota bacterium]MBU4035871.1 cob(I)yrinic acid a,c-diamide adenosyltransferase [Pseudomonadota bacterium]